MICLFVVCEGIVGIYNLMQLFCIGGYDQNRVFLGMGRLVNGRVNFELGDQMQYVNDTVQDRVNHVMMVGVSVFNLDDLL